MQGQLQQPGRSVAKHQHRFLSIAPACEPRPSLPKIRALPSLKATMLPQLHAHPQAGGLLPA